MGVQVSCEDLFADRHWRVCHAYATFVTQRTNTGNKVKGGLKEFETIMNILAFKSVYDVAGGNLLQYWLHIYTDVII